MEVSVTGSKWWADPWFEKDGSGLNEDGIDFAGWLRDQGEPELAEDLSAQNWSDRVAKRLPGLVKKYTKARQNP